MASDRATPSARGPARWWRRWATLALLGAAMWSADCSGGCDCGGSTATAVPATAQERLTAFATTLPAEVDAAIFMVDMDGVRGSAKHMSERFEGNLPVDAYRQEIKRVAGIDLLDASTYDAAGIHPNGGLAVASFRNAPVVVFYTSGRAKLAKGLVANLAKYYRASAPPKPSEDGITVVKGSPVSFAYTILDGGLTVVAGPALATPNSPAQDAEAVLKTVLDTSAPLAETENFKAFRARVGDTWPASAYVSTPRVLAFYKEMAPSLKRWQTEILDAFSTQITWTGVGGSADAGRVQGDAFFGVNPETLAAMKGLDKPVRKPPNFKVLVGEDAYAFGRLSISAEIFWREYQKLLPKTQLKLIKRLFRNTKASTGLDVERDLILNATGNVGLSVYGIHPKHFNARMTSDRLKSVDLMFHYQARDIAAFTKVLDGLVEELAGSILKQQLAGGIIRYGFRPTATTAPPFAIYVMSDLVTIASTSFSMADVHAVLIGDGTSLAKRISSETGKALVTDEVSNGLYVSIDRTKANLGAVAQSGIAKALLGPMRDLSFILSIDDAGLRAHGELTLGAPSAGAVPKGAGPKGATPSPDGKAPTPPEGDDAAPKTPDPPYDPKPTSPPPPPAKGAGADDAAAADGGAP